MSREVPSSVIPHAVNIQAIGATQQQTDTAFNDLKQIGGWPASQKIKRIQLIEVFATDTAIRGIRIYYVLTDSRLVHILHGQAVGQLNGVPFDNDSMIFAGIFGGRDIDSHIASIGFVRYDPRITANPPVEIFGPFGSHSPPASTFGAYGEIIAFTGTENNETGLQSLEFIKADEVVPPKVF